MIRKPIATLVLCIATLIIPAITYAQMTLVGGVITNGSASLSSSGGQLIVTVGQPLVGDTQGLSGGFWYGPGNTVLPTAAEENPFESAIPQTFRLHQNYPNPFNPTTTITYDVAEHAFVRLELFNVLGQKCRTLISAEKPAGTYTIPWDARTDEGQSVSSGFYIYRLQAGDFIQVRQMLLLK